MILIETLSEVSVTLESLLIESSHISTMRLLVLSITIIHLFCLDRTYPLTYSVGMDPEHVKQSREQSLEVNPLYWHRFVNNISISQLAKDFGVTESTIIRTEQGLYNEIPPNVLRHLAAHSLSPNTVRRQYARYQTCQRLKSGARYNRRTYSFYRSMVAQNPEENPLVLFREKFLGYKSRLAFCKDFCLHPSTVKRVEDGLSQTLPQSILDALGEAGFDGWLLEKLLENYLVWLRSNE